MSKIFIQISESDILICKNAYAIIAIGEKKWQVHTDKKE